MAPQHLRWEHLFDAEELVLPSCICDSCMTSIAALCLLGKR